MQCISRQTAKGLVSAWLSEESTYGISGYGIDASKSALIISMKSQGVLAGVPFVDALVEHLGCEVQWHVKEGEALQSSTKIASITGATADLVHAELLIQNILTRASSIATFAMRLKKLLNEFSWKGEFVSPFTYTPGFAKVEEHAAFVAGVQSSKNMSSILLPFSQAETAGGIKEAIAAIKTKAGKNAQITVECECLQEAKTATEAGASCIRFDGLSAKDLGHFSIQLKTSSPSLIIEASGNFDETTLRQFSLPNVDTLTTRRLYNGYPIVEFAMNYDSVDMTPKSPNIVSPQKRPSAPEESDHSGADTGVPDEHEQSGDDSLAVKRVKCENKSPVSAVLKTVKSTQPSQEKPVGEKPKHAPTTPAKKNEKANGSRLPSDNANKKQQQRQQQFTSRQHQIQRNRALQHPRRTFDQPMPVGNNNPGGPLPRVGMLPKSANNSMGIRNNQPPHQQRATAFLNQARMMNLALNQRGPMGSANGNFMSTAAATAALLSSHNSQTAMCGPIVHPQRPQRGLIGSNAPNQWSIMGGPPPYRGGGGGVGACCRFCGAPSIHGMPFCRNCRTPTR